MGIALLMAGFALFFGLFGLLFIFILVVDIEERQKEDDESGTEH